MPINSVSIISQLIGSAPLEELKSVSSNLSLVAPAARSSMIEALELYIRKAGILLAEKLVISELNKVRGSTKFWDFAGRRKFNIDIDSGQGIDFEDAQPELEYPEFYDQLVEDLKNYGTDHYPSEFGVSVIPYSRDEIKIILIGQKIDEENFYTGRWKSVYSVSSAGQISGSIYLDIHYFEDGNVRLNYEENITNISSQFDSSNILNAINNIENQLTVKIIQDFNLLNQNAFKNLRRLLPVTKSKINWGKAIGNYKLGSSVINQN